MPRIDPRVDAYLSQKPEFARPILEHLRALVHRVVPDVEETIKWGMPYFVRNGRLFCMMAAFKQHVAFGFWDAPHMKDAKKLLSAANTSMGHFGRIATKADLPPASVIRAYLKEALELNERGVKTVPLRTGSNPKKVPPMPAFFKSALARDEKAKAGFDALPPSHKREYLLWITEAKKEETRDRRVAQALEWIAAGKSRNWKYEKGAAEPVGRRAGPT